MAMRKRRNLLILAIIILVVAIVLSSFAYMNSQKPYAGNVEYNLASWRQFPSNSNSLNLRS